MPFISRQAIEQTAQERGLHTPCMGLPREIAGSAGSPLGTGEPWGSAHCCTHRNGPCCPALPQLHWTRHFTSLWGTEGQKNKTNVANQHQITISVHCDELLLRLVTGNGIYKKVNPKKFPLLRLTYHGSWSYCLQHLHLKRLWHHSKKQDDRRLFFLFYVILRDP